MAVGLTETGESELSIDVSGTDIGKGSTVAGPIGDVSGDYGNRSMDVNVRGDMPPSSPDIVKSPNDE